MATETHTQAEGGRGPSRYKSQPPYDGFSHVRGLRQTTCFLPWASHYSTPRATQGPVLCDQHVKKVRRARRGPFTARPYINAHEAGPELSQQCPFQRPCRRAGRSLHKDYHPLPLHMITVLCKPPGRVLCDANVESDVPAEDGRHLAPTDPEGCIEGNTLIILHIDDGSACVPRTPG